MGGDPLKLLGAARGRRCSPLERHSLNNQGSRVRHLVSFQTLDGLGSRAAQGGSLHPDGRGDLTFMTNPSFRPSVESATPSRKEHR